MIETSWSWVITVTLPSKGSVLWLILWTRCWPDASRREIVKEPPHYRLLGTRVRCVGVFQRLHTWIKQPEQNVHPPVNSCIRHSPQCMLSCNLIIEDEIPLQFHPRLALTPGWHGWNTRVKLPHRVEDVWKVSACITKSPWQRIKNMRCSWTIDISTIYINKPRFLKATCIERKKRAPSVVYFLRKFMCTFVQRRQKRQKRHNRDSNAGPRDLQSHALATELLRRWTFAHPYSI